MCGVASLSARSPAVGQDQGIFFFFSKERKSPGTTEFVSRLTAHIKMILKKERKRERRNKKNYTDRAYIDAVRGKGQKKELKEEDFLRMGRRRRRRCAFEAIWSRGDFRMMSEHYVSKK